MVVVCIFHHPVFFSPIIGNLSDKYGRRPIILMSLFIRNGLHHVELGTYYRMDFPKVIAGITGASFTTASAYIADISTNENRAQNFE
jgi:DHA1 family tetracycline resistance protein-like MFS transporter